MQRRDRDVAVADGHVIAVGLAGATELETESGGHTKFRAVGQAYPADSIYQDVVGSSATDLSASLRLKFNARAGRFGNLRQLLLTYLIGMALADGRIDTAEDAVLQELI